MYLSEIHRLILNYVTESSAWPPLPHVTVSLTFIHNFAIFAVESKMLRHVASQVVWCHDYVFSH